MPRASYHTRRQASVDYPRHPPKSLQAQNIPDAHQGLPPSDYESDNAAYLSDLPASRPPQPRTNDELNLTVLRRHRPEVASILSIAPYAVIYEFNPQPEPTWNKSGIEGSLFICQLTPGPRLGEDRYTAIVLNRRGMENFDAELREADKTGVEIKDDYVIISLVEHGVQKIFGVFIFSEGPGSSTEKTRKLNAELMKQCAIQASSSLKTAEAAAAEALPGQKNGHAHSNEPSVQDAALGVPMGRQTSLQELFGRQRVEDASFSVRVHSPTGRGHTDGMEQQLLDRNRQAPLGPQTAALPQQQDILGYLFRRAGLDYQPR